MAVQWAHRPTPPWFRLFLPPSRLSEGITEVRSRMTTEVETQGTTFSVKMFTCFSVLLANTDRTLLTLVRVLVTKPCSVVLLTLGIGTQAFR